MAGTFATWQPEYAARGLATFPYTASNADRRRPLVGNYTRMGLSASRQLILKYPDADGLFCMAGVRNKLTVIDVDARGAEGERLLADALRRYGQARIVVRTGRGGYHAYFKHSGEPRKIRPAPATPIDLLGGGPVVLPPSKGSQFNYEIIHGTIDDLAALTPIRRDAVMPGADNFDVLAAAQDGERDKKYWPYVKRFANQAASYEALLEHAREINEMMPEPLPDSQVVDKCRHWWKKTERGENKWGVGNFTTVDHALIDGLMMKDPDAFTLLMFLRRLHWGREFPLANETCTLLPLNGSRLGQVGWDRERFADARARLIRAGFLIVVREATFKPQPSPMFCRLG